MTALNNPGLAGDLPFDTVIYASALLNYPPVLVQYKPFENPDPAYVTGRINISAFAHLGTAPWPFTNHNVPLNGRIFACRAVGDPSHWPCLRTATTTRWKTPRRDTCTSVSYWHRTELSPPL